MFANQMGGRWHVIVAFLVCLVTSELEDLFVFVEDGGIFLSGNYLFILLPIRVLGHLAFLIDLGGFNIWAK